MNDERAMLLTGAGDNNDPYRIGCIGEHFELNVYDSALDSSNTCTCVRRRPGSLGRVADDVRLLW